ncbi:MAG TPA: adhesin [Phycisphaerales bacterium]|nr:adhesin [Phycisphaerales bacterium]
MRLPNAENAIIDPAKLYDYVLSPIHPVGRFKAAFFASLGYTCENWRQFEADLRREHLNKNAILRHTTAYGKKWEISSTIKGPSGKAKRVVSIWIVLTGQEVPRFVTAYPGDLP